MFMEKGFNDFLAKPIDVSKLDEILARWIPKEKQKKNIETEKKLIILVDDNVANLRSGKNLLSEKHRVATAPSAEKMFALLENNTPALIFLDIEMPEMDGYEAIRILKVKPQTKDIPVIFLADAAADEEKGSALGAIGIITKPFDPANLATRIEKIIGN